MAKNLPKVFANPINKPFTNNRESFYSSLTNEPTDRKTINVLERVNEIFASKHHVYKSFVHIKTLTSDFNTEIVGQTSNSLLTLDGAKIPLNTIIYIEKI